MNQSNNETSNNKHKKVSLKNFAIFGAIAFALIATMIPAYTYVVAFEQHAGDGGSGGTGGTGGNGGITGFNAALGGPGGEGGSGGSGGTGGDGGSDNNGIVFDDYEIVGSFSEALEEATGFGLSGDVDADGGDADGGSGGSGGSGGDAGVQNNGDADGGDGGDSGDGGKGGSAIAICNTLACL